MRTLRATGFLLGALIIAWLGALADTFVFPMDRASRMALGSPEFAYGPILVSRVLVASAGALVFGVSTIFLGADAPNRGRGFVKGTCYGAVYSVLLVALLHLAMWSETGTAVVGLWAGTLVLPIGAAWLCARPTSRLIEDGVNT